MQLPELFLIVGDFNTRSFTWGDIENNEHGDIIEDLLLASNVCVLNTGSLTHAHKQTDTLTCVDLTLTLSDIFVELKWQVEDMIFHAAFNVSHSLPKEITLSDITFTKQIGNYSKF